ncbi:hypothetical protein VTK56DRAFT_6211 [Thermocarpiscus australiensis]
MESRAPTTSLTHYAAFVDPETAAPRIGHFDLVANTIQPLSFTSGTPIANLYQVIEAGPAKIMAAPGQEPIPASVVKLLAPISSRDVLAVGKNYMDHAKEFNSSGFDSSDRVDRPSHPVIFTKRATSIIASGDDIYPHAGFTETLDYEGEIGVIVGRAGFRIREEDAWDHVWGYTIVNDMTARERQRDHKQFFIGKSADTFCPMGPVAVPKEALPSTLRLQTHVNGELRQGATSDDLIFSIPTLISTISAGQTIQPGDVIATGTPAGVGIGKKPPVYLQPGDEVSVSVTGLGTLRNKVSAPTAPNPTPSRWAAQSSFSPYFPTYGPAKPLSLPRAGPLTTINSKPVHYQRLGAGPRHVVFVHGLGGTLDFWRALVSALSLAASHTCHLFDLEGHGLSPTHPLAELSLSSFAADIRAVLAHAGVFPANRATVVAHSMGCLAALRLALDGDAAAAGLVGDLILLGPPASPLPEAAVRGSLARADAVRKGGMAAVVDAVVEAGTSARSKREKPVGVAAVRLSLLGQDPEGYAKGCWALAGAGAEGLEVEKLGANGRKVLIVTGDEDKVSPPELCEKYAQRIRAAEVVVLKGVGHWHVFEDVEGVAKAVKSVL